jgi:rhodanese-related sulfurtransferase
MKTHETPQKQNFNIEGVKHISANDAFELVSKNEIYLLDAREHDETAISFLDFQNVLFYPMSNIMESIESIRKDIIIVTFCESGTRGTKIANLLSRLGYKNVANMDGGLNEWKLQNLPVVETDIQKDITGCNSSECGCSCSGCS